MQPDWEIWLDVHFSPAIAKWMADYTGSIVKSAYSLSLYNLSDFEVYEKAKNKGPVILISKDADFSEIINRLGAPPKLISVRIGNCSNALMWEFLKKSIKNSIQILAETEATVVELH